MPYKDAEQQREYMRLWMAKRRADWLAENGPCVDCGSAEQLEVDHVDASTKVSHRVWSWTAVRRAAELTKCVVRCLPCHGRKTTASGEHPRGELSGHALLTEVAVREIKSSCAPRKALAAKFHVSPETIKSVRAGRSWRHVV
jgi:hypothetical protein